MSRVFQLLSNSRCVSNLLKTEYTISFYYPWHKCALSTSNPRNDSLIKYRQLHPKRLLKDDGKLFGQKKYACEFLNGLPRTIFFQNKNNQGKKKRVPKLILVQNPLKWFKVKMDFTVLRNVWDPSFHEKDFRYGTKQAIARVTNVISQGQFSELNGLLTKAARKSLMRELERNWSDRQRTLLALKLDDIQISAPRKVYFIRVADKKYCDVDMAFLALKWVPINSSEFLIFTEIFARFHREYTPHCIPEWTIAYFKVTRFEVVRRR